MYCLSLSAAYFWSLQTEYWADRFPKCLKMFHFTYFLAIIIRFWHFSLAAFTEKKPAERVHKLWLTPIYWSGLGNRASVRVRFYG